MGEYKVVDAKKALLLPVNSKKELFIQDRRGYKKPDWGFFGGGIEAGESPLEAVIRESSEELCLKLTEKDLIDLGVSEAQWDQWYIVRYLFLYQTDQEKFDVREGCGGIWLSFDKVRELMDDKDRFDEVVERIQRVVSR